MKSALKISVFSVIATVALASNAFAMQTLRDDSNINRPRPHGPRVGVPEPGTLGLMGVGLLAVGIIARRRK